MNRDLEKVIISIVTYATDRGISIATTKLLKLLYLFDVEFFRAHRQIFTGFAWKYYHLGPWTPEYEGVLQNLVDQGDLIPKPFQRGEIEGTSYKAAEPMDIDRLFQDSETERALRRVLGTWAEAPTSEILDYIYFHTEPMINGTRNQPLDFSNIPPHLPKLYARSSSGKSREEITELKKRFYEALSQNKIGDTVEFTPPKYDDEYFEAMKKLEDDSDVY